MFFVYIEKCAKNLKPTLSYTRVDEFLRDDDFIRYVMDASPEQEEYWTSYQSASPSVRAAFRQAFNILTHLDDCRLLSPDQVRCLRLRIQRTVLLSKFQS